MFGKWGQLWWSSQFKSLVLPHKVAVVTPVLQYHKHLMGWTQPCQVLLLISLTVLTKIGGQMCVPEEKAFASPRSHSAPYRSMFVVKWLCINNAAFSNDVPQTCLMTSTKTQVTSGQFSTDMCEDTTNTGTLWSQRLCIRQEVEATDLFTCCRHIWLPIRHLCDDNACLFHTWRHLIFYIKNILTCIKAVCCFVRTPVYIKLIIKWLINTDGQKLKVNPHGLLIPLFLFYLVSLCSLRRPWLESVFLCLFLYHSLCIPSTSPACPWLPSLVLRSVCSHYHLWLFFIHLSSWL